MADQRPQEREIGGDTGDLEFAQRLGQAAERLRAIRPVDDQLRQQRVVIGRDGIAGPKAGIDADVVSGRLAPQPDRSRRRQETLVGVLGIDARLDGVAMHRDLVLAQRQRLAHGDAQLPLHEVEAGDQLGDGVLDLQAGVHLDEVEARGVGDELDRARADIAGGLRGGAGGGRHLRAALRRDGDRRRLLDHLLVAALQRAFALEQRDHVAMGVTEHLHLDMARRGDQLLDQEAVVAEGRGRLAPRAGDGFLELAGRGDGAHAPASASCRRLDQHRIAEAIGGRRERREGLILAVIAGHHRHAAAFHQRLRRRLRAHQADGRGRRADEDEIGVGAGLRKIGVLGEKSITGMHGLGAGLVGGVDDGVDAKVAVLGRRRADEHRRVGERDVHGAAISVGVDRHRREPHALCRADDPAGDLAAVGDQELVEAPGERHHHILKMPNRVGSGGGALRPAASARPSTVRVSAGSTMPSSQMRAVA